MTIYTTNKIRRRVVPQRRWNRHAALLKNGPLQYTSHILEVDISNVDAVASGARPLGDRFANEFDFEGYCYSGVASDITMLGFARVKNSFSMRDLCYNPKTQRILL